MVTGHDIYNTIRCNDLLTFNQLIFGISLDDDTAKTSALSALSETLSATVQMADLLITSFAITFRPGDLTQVLEDFCQQGIPTREAEAGFKKFGK